MSARVMIHPHCVSGLGAEMLAKTLDDHGFDLHTVVISPANRKGRHELVRRLRVQDGLLPAIYERMNGTRFEHWTGTLTPDAA